MTKADVLGPTTSPPLLFSSSSSSPSLSSLPLMASVAARFNRLHHSSLFLAPCLGQPASSSKSLLCLPSHRHAMMSALSHDHPRHPPSSPSPSSSSASPSPTLGETPPRSHPLTFDSALCQAFVTRRPLPASRCSPPIGTQSRATQADSQSYQGSYHSRTSKFLFFDLV